MSMIASQIIRSWDAYPCTQTPYGLIKNIRREGNHWFIIINFLTWRMTESLKSLLDAIDLVFLFLRKKNEIVCKKEIWNGGCFFSSPLQVRLLDNLKYKKRRKGSQMDGSIGIMIWCLWKWCNDEIFGRGTMPLRKKLEFINRSIEENWVAWEGTWHYAHAGGGSEFQQEEANLHRLGLFLFD